MQVELEAKTRQENAQSAAQAPAKPQKKKASEMAKWVYTFGDGAAEGKADTETVFVTKTSSARATSTRS